MMAFTPIEEPFSRGLSKMRKEEGVKIQLPTNISELKLHRVYRCSQDILKFHEGIAKRINKSPLAYSKLNSSSLAPTTGHEIYGNKPEVFFLPSCRCFYPCSKPVSHLMVKHWTKILQVLNSAKKCAGKKITIVIATAKKDIKCVQWIKQELEKQNFVDDFDVKTIDQCRGNEYGTLVAIFNSSNSRGGFFPWLQGQYSQNHTQGRPNHYVMDVFTRVTTSLFIIHMNDMFMDIWKRPYFGPRLWAQQLNQ